MPFVDFECPNNHITECFFPQGIQPTDTVECGFCRAWANKIESVRGKTTDKAFRIIMDSLPRIERPSKDEIEIGNTQN